MRTDKPPIYPIEPWSITETSFDKEQNYRNETAFSLANGYIGTRGTFEEAYPFDIETGLEGNFVNGFYESERIRYGEANFGSPEFSQSLLNLPNMKETKVYLEGELFTMEEGKTEEYKRILDMKGAVLTRSLLYTSPGGRKAEICIKRLVSFEMKHIMAIEYQVTPLNFSGEIKFVSRLQADVENHTRKTNPIVDYGPFGRRLRFYWRETGRPFIIRGLLRAADGLWRAEEATESTEAQALFAIRSGPESWMRNWC